MEKDKPNYITLINRFWTLNNEHCFNASEIALYFHLLDVSNSLAWKNPFKQGNLKICVSINISEPTIQRARERLVKAGLIKFTSGKVKRELTEYYLIEGKNNGERLGTNNVYPIITPTLGQSSTQSSTLNDTQPFTEPLDFNRDKQKQDLNFINISGVKIFENEIIEWFNKTFPLQKPNYQKLYPLANIDDCLKKFIFLKAFESFKDISHFKNSFAYVLKDEQKENSKKKESSGGAAGGKITKEVQLNQEQHARNQAKYGNTEAN